MKTKTQAKQVTDKQKIDNISTAAKDCVDAFNEYFNAYGHNNNPQLMEAKRRLDKINQIVQSGKFYVNVVPFIASLDRFIKSRVKSYQTGRLDTRYCVPICKLNDAVNKNWLTWELRGNSIVLNCLLTGSVGHIELDTDWSVMDDYCWIVAGSRSNIKLALNFVNFIWSVKNEVSNKIFGIERDARSSGKPATAAQMKKFFETEAKRIIDLKLEMTDIKL